MEINLIQENIRNLTSLWQTVAKKAGAYYRGSMFDFCDIGYSNWPNKLWFHQDLNEEDLAEAREIILAAKARLVVPYWDINGRQSNKLLEANGFEKTSEQIGMSMPLRKPYEKAKNLRLEKVSGKRTAKLWQKLFMESFGYEISFKLLLPDYAESSYLIAYTINDEPVGTAILHYTHDIAGIHSMGIIPEMRRKGFAEQMMRALLNQSLAKGSKYTTLQASEMGKGLYLKLGYAEQFVMKNYILKERLEA